MEGYLIPVLELGGLTFSCTAPEARGLLAVFYYIYYAKTAKDGCTYMPRLFALLEFCRMKELERS